MMTRGKKAGTCCPSWMKCMPGIVNEITAEAWTVESPEVNHMIKTVLQQEQCCSHVISRRTCDITHHHARSAAHTRYPVE
eukprot:1114838-Rhodomonas_salina.1